jgi:hemerythrin HHE cation binding domain-containing protein
MTEPQNDDRRRAAGDFLCRVHADLRSSISVLRQQLDDTLAGRPAADPPKPDLRAQLALGCLRMCDLLSDHHLHEDEDFGHLERHFPQLVPAVRRLRDEHEAVARSLDELRELLGRFAAGEVGAEVVRDEFARLSTGLEDHFAYEEEQLVPLLNAVS